MQSNIVRISGPNWASPDLSLLGGGTAPAPAFPRELLGADWDGWCSEVSASANAPYDYVGASLLTLAAALIGNSRVAAFGDWTAPAIVWTALIGSPSAKKSPAMAPFKRHIAALEAELADEAYVQGAPAPQIHIGDVTARAAQEVATHNEKGLLLNLDELSGWWDQISRSGGEQFWLEAFGGDSYIVNRFDQAPVRIPHLSVSVLGGTQPDTIRKLVESKTDRGFNSRWLYIYPDVVEGFRRPVRVDQTKATGAFQRIRALELDDGEPVRCDLSPEAEVAAEEWLVSHQQVTAKAEGVWQQWSGKQDGMLLRYALILEHLWWAADPSRQKDGPEQIGPLAIQAAAVFIDEYATPMAMRSFNMAARPQDERWAAFLARLIQRQGVRQFNAREVRRNALGPVGQLAQADAMAAACEVLEAAHLIRHTGSRTGATKGRLPQTYEVNPMLLSAGIKP